MKITSYMWYGESYWIWYVTLALAVALLIGLASYKRKGRRK